MVSADGVVAVLGQRVSEYRTGRAGAEYWDRRQQTTTCLPGQAFIFGAAGSSPGQKLSGDDEFPLDGQGWRDPIMKPSCLFSL